MGESLENLASELGVWALGDSFEAGELGVEEGGLGLCGIALFHVIFVVASRLQSVPVAYLHTK